MYRDLTTEEEMKLQEITNITDWQASLCRLLLDCVNQGASVGFMAPMKMAEATQYWSSAAIDLAEGRRRLWVISEGAQILGAVQLSLTAKANGRHRGEVEKLMVHNDARGRGLAKRLMMMLEQQAIASGLQLLVLDTRLGDVASRLYRRLGFVEAGQIPDFARNSDGSLAATVMFYKRLVAGCQ